jgi:hypothetical protein
MTEEQWDKLTGRPYEPSGHPTLPFQVILFDNGIVHVRSITKEREDADALCRHLNQRMYAKLKGANGHDRGA